MKRPFSIRVEPHVINRYRAMSTILNIDGAKLLEELIQCKERDLTKDQQNAYEALLKIWKEEDID